ncbi:hypothetical protein [Pelagibius sp. Alg239-R121]|uniref:hypothetical protein n=1 Tax=Pelagibius sp. Alg239-R121 TaxID=2993448 RepID=UPI0024A7210B|nr:hypothetical protein [Pelagibius sp. Alg239-R121]
MRVISPLAALGMGLIVLSACAQKPAPNQQPVTASTATESSAKTGTDWLHEELMVKILKQKIISVGIGSNHKKGDPNPYREGMRGSAHKALSACLVWDLENVSVTYKRAHMGGGSDQSNAEFVALRNCRNKKRQFQYDCTCQLIDSDDENVLKVPADFLAKYEKKFRASTE